jgi:putative ABC transport system substrate-binding protein
MSTDKKGGNTIMKNSRKITALLLAVTVLFSLLLTGCGGETVDVSADIDSTSESQSQPETDKTADANVDTSSTGTADNSAASAEKADTTKKKIIVIKEVNDEVRDAVHKNILAVLEKSGYSNDTSTISVIEMGGDEKRSTEVLEQIKTEKPDVVLINGVQFVFKTIAKPLEGSGIPVVLVAGVENKLMDFVDENGKPKQNITGVYTMPKDMQLNAFKLLQEICPINGKKAVFVTLEDKFTKEEIENNLKQIGVELKDFVEVKYQEEFTEATNKYNLDDEVGWILVGYWPGARKDGKASTNLEYGKFDVANRKKPSVTYFEAAVKIGILAGLGADIAEQGSQAAEMAVKILDGEKTENVTAQAPRKINIVLNQKNAEENNIEIPLKILTSAYKVYTDYEGNYKN